MRSATIVLSLLLLLPLAGCFENGNTTPDSPSPSPPKKPNPYAGDQPFTVPFNGTDCREGNAVALITFAQAQASLPEGYEAEDAGKLLDAPTALDRAAIFFNSRYCSALTDQLSESAMSIGEVGIYVKPPTGVNGTREPSSLDFYLLYQYTNEERYYEFHEKLNATVVYANKAEAQLSRLQNGGASGSGNVKDEENKGYTYGFTAPYNEEAYAGLVRFWHETSLGTLIYDADLTGHISQGSGNCALTPGAGPAQAAGFTNCPPETLGVAFYDMDWTGTLEFIPKA